MVHGENRIPYWIDRRLTGLAGPDNDATISFGLPFAPEDSQYGEYRLTGLAGPEYHAIISFGLPIEPEDSQYGKYRVVYFHGHAFGDFNMVTELIETVWRIITAASQGEDEPHD